MIPFIHRDPTAEEERILALLLSTFSDGSGTQRESDGTSRAGWKEIERIFSEFLTGKKHNEDKDVFDLIARDWSLPKAFYGVSIKSKQLTGPRTIFRAHPDARAYLEISNSPAKMWAGITSLTGLGPADFANQLHPQAIGDALLQTIELWKTQRKTKFENDNQGSNLDLGHCSYLTLSFSEYLAGSRSVQISSFPMSFPQVQWRYNSARCLAADDPARPGERLLDWYASSGGQLKYYPLFNSAQYRSSIMQTEKVGEVSIIRKAIIYFPDEMEALLAGLRPEHAQLIEHLWDEDV